MSYIEIPYRASPYSPPHMNTIPLRGPCECYQDWTDFLSNLPAGQIWGQ